MTDLRSRVHLFDEKLTLLPEFMPHFDTWAMMQPTGQTTKVDLAALGIDSWMRPACASFAQAIGPEPGGMSMDQVTAALQTSFGDIKPGIWDSLYKGMSAVGKSTWPKLNGPIVGGKPFELGKIRPDGTPEYNSVTDLIDGKEIGSSSVYFRIYKHAGRNVDILPKIYIGTSRDDAPAFRGIGGGLRIGEDLKIDANLGLGQTRALQGGVQLEFRWDFPWPTKSK